jgi:hypothetical protein
MSRARINPARWIDEIYVVYTKGANRLRASTRSLFVRALAPRVLPGIFLKGDRFMFAAREDVLETAAIELERMFTVLSNVYGKDKFPKHAGLIPQIETEFRACLKKISQTEIDSKPDRDA